MESYFRGAISNPDLTPARTNRTGPVLGGGVEEIAWRCFWSGIKLLLGPDGFDLADKWLRSTGNIAGFAKRLSFGVENENCRETLYSESLLEFGVLFSQLVALRFAVWKIYFEQNQICFRVLCKLRRVENFLL